MTGAPNGILEGPVARAVLRLAWPMLASAALQNVQSVIDLFWVGRLGPATVAAVAMSGTILMLLYPMLMGLATGTTALVARATGARRPDDAAQALGQSILLALTLGALAGGVGWFSAEPLLRRLGAAPEVIGPGGAYLRLSMLGSVAVFLLFTANAALQGAGDTLTPMRVMMLSNLINLVLDPLLIFGPGPLPALGIRGAALATVAAEAAAALVVLGRLLGGRHALHVRPRHLRPDRDLLARLLRIGIPGSGQMLSRSLMNAVMMAIVAGCGTAAVAAFGTGFRLHMIVLMPAFALGNAAATLMGQNLGAGQPDRARRAAWTATGLDALVMLGASILMLPAAELFIRLFNEDPAVVAAGAHYLRVVSPFYLFVAPAIVLSRALNGAGDSFAPMVITILVLWGFQVPAAIWLSRRLDPATEGIWWAMAATSLLHGLLVMGWFGTGRWKRARV